MKIISAFNSKKFIDKQWLKWFRVELGLKRHVLLLIKLKIKKSVYFRVPELFIFDFWALRQGEERLPLL